MTRIEYPHIYRLKQKPTNHPYPITIHTEKNLHSPIHRYTKPSATIPKTTKLALLRSSGGRTCTIRFTATHALSYNTSVKVARDRETTPAHLSLPTCERGALGRCIALTRQNTRRVLGSRRSLVRRVARALLHLLRHSLSPNSLWTNNSVDFFAWRLWLEAWWCEVFLWFVGSIGE